MNIAWSCTIHTPSATTISKTHAVVVIEDLHVRNMSKSGAGTSEKPGKNVGAKSGLNRSILDQGWAAFRVMLAYKLACMGGTLIAVSPRNTSRTCPLCGHVSADNRKTQARLICVECGYENNADHVGAINILAAGHAVSASEIFHPHAGVSAEEPSEVALAVSA